MTACARLVGPRGPHVVNVTPLSALALPHTDGDIWSTDSCGVLEALIVSCPNGCDAQGKACLTCEQACQQAGRECGDYLTRARQGRVRSARRRRGRLHDHPSRQSRSLRAAPVLSSQYLRSPHLRDLPVNPFDDQ